MATHTNLERSKRECKELHSAGVYFLLGKSEENNQDIIYIGQAEERENGKGLLGRIEAAQVEGEVLLPQVDEIGRAHV